MMNFFAYNLYLGYNMWYDKYTLMVLNEEDKKERDFLFFEKDVWDRVTEYLPSQGFNTIVIDLAEGVKYDCAPELAVKGSLSKEEFSEMLSRLRELGLTPIPKLDFSTAHDIWMKNYSRMPGTEPYRAFVRNIIAEVAELFEYPKYFHIGMGDESNAYQKYYGYIATRSRTLFWEDTNIMFEACRKADARPMMNGEYFYREPYVFEKEIPVDVVITVPYFEYIVPEINVYGRDQRTPDQKNFESLAAIKNDVVYNGRGVNAYNLDRLFKYASRHQDNCIGVMDTPDEPCVDRVDYVLLNDAYRFGLAKRTYFPEL